MNTPINLEIKPLVGFLSEISQSMDIKFAFVTKIDDNNYKQVMTEVKCRDFLGDLLYSRKYSKPASIYGFNYNYKESPYDDDKLRLSLKFPVPEALEFFRGNYGSNVRYAEQLSKVEPSIIIETNIPNTIIIEADKAWQSEVWKLSLFTFYLKLISYQDLNSIKQPELKYYTTLKKSNKEDFLLSLINKDNKDTINSEIHYAHNDSGFISLINNRHYLSSKNSFWKECNV
jgi:hypothetical protein